MGAAQSPFEYTSRTIVPATLQEQSCKISKSFGKNLTEYVYGPGPQQHYNGLADFYKALSSNLFSWASLKSDVEADVAKGATAVIDW